MSQSITEAHVEIFTEPLPNLYMLHGGTSFGFTSGANDNKDGYAPNVSRYDFQAPLDEAGRPTPRYWAFRELLARQQPSGETLPDVPSSAAPLTIAEFELTHSASLWDALPVPFLRAHPQPMEMFGQSQGLILYRTSLAGLGAGELKIVDAHDYATVLVNGQRVGTLDRRLRENTFALTDVPEDVAQLDILVDTTGRTNFGPVLADWAAADAVRAGRVAAPRSG